MPTRRADRRASFQPTPGRARWPGSPASSHPKARRRGRRGRRRAIAAGRPPAARTLGECPGNACEGDHEADALQGEPFRSGNQRHAEGDNEGRDVDEDDHARCGRELQADEDAEELGAEQRAREQAALERAVAREQRDAASTGPEPDQDRRAGRAHRRLPEGGTSGSAAFAATWFRPQRKQQRMRTTTARASTWALRSARPLRAAPPASLPSLREEGGLLRSPFSLVEPRPDASSLRQAEPPSRRRRDRWRGRMARW